MTRFFADKKKNRIAIWWPHLNLLVDAKLRKDRRNK